jgi:hypothetical protein
MCGGIAMGNLSFKTPIADSPKNSKGFKVENMQIIIVFILSSKLNRANPYIRDEFRFERIVVPQRSHE